MVDDKVFLEIIREKNPGKHGYQVCSDCQGRGIKENDICFECEGIGLTLKKGRKENGYCKANS